jgi:hypothetical protein
MLARHVRRVCTRVARLLSLLGVVVAILWSRPAHAYPWMIRHEYQGCVPCHADPSGAGLLTEYGRAMGENVMRTRYGSKPPDEPASYARFLWGVPTPDWLLLGGSVRNGVQFLKEPGQPVQCSHFNDSGCAFLQMEADLKAQITVSRFRAYGSLGYMHQGAQYAQLTTRAEDNLVSREHWIGVDLGDDKQFLLRAGRIDIPFGIRNDEHDLLVRSTQTTRTNINESQQYGVAFYASGEKARGEVMAVLGNYQLTPDVFRERGYAGYVEFNLAQKVGAGISSLVTYAGQDVVMQTVHTVRQVHGLFTRASPHEMVVLLAEADATINTSTTGTIPGAIAMLQLDLEPTQGLHLIGTGEAMVQGDLPAAISPSGRAASYDGWAGVLWFFAPHCDARFDFVASSVLNGGVSYYALPQLHFYL